MQPPMYNSDDPDTATPPKRRRRGYYGTDDSDYEQVSEIKKKGHSTKNARGKRGMDEICKREGNYTSEEVELLIRLVGEAKDIIESKRTDAKTIAQKDLVWRNIEREFNAPCIGGVYRTEKSLKKKLNNLKVSLKKRQAEGKNVSKDPLYTVLYEKRENAYESSAMKLNDEQHEVRRVKCEQSPEFEWYEAENLSGADDETEDLHMANSTLDEEQETWHDYDSDEHIQHKNDIKHRMAAVPHRRNTNVAQKLSWSLRLANIKAKWTEEKLKTELKFLTEEHNKKMELMIEKSKLEMHLMRDKHRLEMDILKKKLALTESSDS